VVSPFGGDLDALSHEACHPWVCVSPLLVEKQPFPLGYLPGRYKEALISPDGRWVAFTARHIYGLEDLLVISWRSHASTINQMKRKSDR
jgi:hypothetical protein